MRVKGVTRNCVVCNKEFYAPNYRRETAKYCSPYCLNHGQYKSIKKICLKCGKEFFVSNSRVKRKFCGELCSYNSKFDIRERRRRNKLWQAKHRGYRSPYIRKQAFEVYGIKCSICEYNEYDFCLDLHHVDGNPQNNDIMNLALLCAICHRKLHKGIIKIERMQIITETEFRRKEEMMSPKETLTPAIKSAPSVKSTTDAHTNLTTPPITTPQSDFGPGEGSKNSIMKK